MPGRTALHWRWATDDVVGHDGKLWWVSLRRGILSCNPFEDRPVLRLDELPETVAEEKQFKSTRHIEADRCVKVSRGRLRYVEIVRAATDPVGATLVVMWTVITGDPEGFTWWKARYGLILDRYGRATATRRTGCRGRSPCSLS
uniref:DUF1618 domain-containing protein n=1 Tax=Arundo donax TaxID=35708 RepID=A0A0A8Y2B4_ARUDO